MFVSPSSLRLRCPRCKQAELRVRGLLDARAFLPRRTIVVCPHCGARIQLTERGCQLWVAGLAMTAVSAAVLGVTSKPFFSGPDFSVAQAVMFSALAGACFAGMGLALGAVMLGLEEAPRKS